MDVEHKMKQTIKSSRSNSDMTSKKEERFTATAMARSMTVATTTTTTRPLCSRGGFELGACHNTAIY